MAAHARRPPAALSPPCPPPALPVRLSARPSRTPLGVLGLGRGSARGLSRPLPGGLVVQGQWRRGASSQSGGAPGSGDANENAGELDFLSIIGALGMWLAYGASIYWTVLRPDAPGDPLWETSPRDVQAFINEAISVWYINPILAHFGWSILPDAPEHPVAEALFSTVMAFDVLLLPLIAGDPRGKNVEQRNALMIGSLFGLNLVVMPYMALRLQQPSTGVQKLDLPGWAPAAGYFGLAMAGMTLFWILFARPEYGGLMDRVAFAQQAFTGNRVFYALCTDCMFFAIFQAILMKGAPLRLRLIPFIGAALWLAFPNAWEESND
ncbi:unnamed protein product [Ostreobium quekettii]|uniref:Uncharacterized protein n=1 Tax=Ostreobium quekettii TaxID=121088 RepID=A0A8S1J8E6_9CHLO|nr:unnamed protein product [Ostreobium quekettii]|eukprot:evm.model.scf_722EXC.1 EVM.evm.TU.scf_722EXC.1   scf_722EXC:1824-5916(+)